MFRNVGISDMRGAVVIHVFSSVPLTLPGFFRVCKFVGFTDTSCHANLKGTPPMQPGTPEEPSLIARLLSSMIPQ